MNEVGNINSKVESRVIVDSKASSLAEKTEEKRPSSESRLKQGWHTIIMINLGSFWTDDELWQVL